MPANLHPLPRSFFSRSPRRVARDLIGKILIHSGEGTRLSARIVEVEAYLGANDPAAHSAAGLTTRNSVLFGPPGFAYVYFIYGNHYCLNVSCEPEGKAGGVLFRAVEPIEGIEEMARARGITIRSPRDLPKLTTGPGRLAQAFGITRSRDNGRATSPRPLPASGSPTTASVQPVESRSPPASASPRLLPTPFATCSQTTVSSPILVSHRKWISSNVCSSGKYPTTPPPTQ